MKALKFLLITGVFSVAATAQTTKGTTVIASPKLATD
jgi:hypothetical protein